MTMGQGIMQGLWEEYERKVLPPEAGHVQRVETCRAFHAGAYALLNAILKRLTPDAEPTAADLHMMESIETELILFAHRVLKEGKPS